MILKCDRLQLPLEMATLLLLHGGVDQDPLIDEFDDYDKNTTFLVYKIVGLIYLLACNYMIE